MTVFRTQSAPRPCASPPEQFLFADSCRQTERQILARVRSALIATVDVPLAVDRVSHRRPALRSRHPDRAEPVPGLLVVGAQHRPRGCSGIVVTCGSPRMTSVLITINPTLPCWPVFGMSRPRNAG